MVIADGLVEPAFKVIVGAAVSIAGGAAAVGYRMFNNLSSRVDHHDEKMHNIEKDHLNFKVEAEKTYVKERTVERLYDVLDKLDNKIDVNMEIISKDIKSILTNLHRT